MTVKELLALVKQIQTKWGANVVNQRPQEQAQLQAHLGSAATYASVTNELARWVTSLTILADKPRVSQTISKPLLTALTTSLMGLAAAIDQARNGVDWIFTQRSFGPWYALSTSLIRDLSLESARETEAIVDAAHARLSQDISVLQSASEQAQKFNES